MFINLIVQQQSLKIKLIIKNLSYITKMNQKYVFSYETNLQACREQFRVEIRKSHRQRNFQLMRTSLPYTLKQQEYEKILYSNLLVLTKAKYGSKDYNNAQKITFTQLQNCVKNINDVIKMVQVPAFLQRDLQPEKYLSILLDIQNKRVAIVKDYVHSCQTITKFVLEIILNISALPNCKIQISDINLEPILQATNLWTICLIFGILGNLLFTQNQTRKKQQLYRLACPKTQAIFVQYNRPQSQNQSYSFKQTTKYLQTQNKCKQEETSKNIIGLILRILRRHQQIRQHPQFQQYLFHFLDSFLVSLREYNLDRSCEKEYIELVQLSLAYIQNIIVKSFECSQQISSNSSQRKFNEVNTKYFFLVRTIYCPLNYFPSKKLLDCIQDNFQPLNKNMLWVFNQYILREQHTIKKESIRQIIQNTMKLAWFLTDQEASQNQAPKKKKNMVQIMIHHLNILLNYMHTYPYGWKLIDCCFRKLSAEKKYYRSTMPNLGALYYLFMIDDNELRFIFLKFLRKLTEQQGNCTYLDAQLIYQLKQQSDEAFSMFEELQLIAVRESVQF